MPQASDRLATLALCIVDAGRRDETSQALSPALREPSFRGRTFAFDARTLGMRSLGRLNLRRRLPGAHEQQQRPQENQSEFHVSDVSTSRFAKARNSGDAISCSRDTVRGNSCASGPSVYNASAGTAADRISLTRRS